MALGGVFITDADGNLGTTNTAANVAVSGFLFDISGQDNFWNYGSAAAFKDKLDGTLIELTSLDQCADYGIVPYSGDTETDLLFGIPYYHIEHFFKIHQGTGRLFIMFADCSENWNAIQVMQRAAHGMIYQLGVWTEQNLWEDSDPEASYYSLNLISEIGEQGAALTRDNAPLSILLCANTATVKTGSIPSEQVDLSRIPTLLSTSGTRRYVSVLLGQEASQQVTTMQKALNSKTPVGCLGAALGVVSSLAVNESLAWVRAADSLGLSDLFSSIEFGFGDVSIDTDDKFVSTLKYAALTSNQIDTFDDKGYIFLCKYAGRESEVYFSKDHTCSSGDYKTIARNRTMNKTRRLVREALLPYTGAPLMVNPSSGTLADSTIATFNSLVRNILAAMVDLGEISGYSVTIDATQNVLKTDTLYISYAVVPVGTADAIRVTQSLALSTSE